MNGSRGRRSAAATLIMVLVLASFFLGDRLAFDQVGLGFAGALFVDAFVICTVLALAVMYVVGRASWSFPHRRNRRSPRLHAESDNTVEFAASLALASADPRE